MKSVLPDCGDGDYLELGVSLWVGHIAILCVALFVMLTVPMWLITCNNGCPAGQSLLHSPLP